MNWPAEGNVDTGDHLPAADGSRTSRPAGGGTGPGQSAHGTGIGRLDDRRRLADHGSAVSGGTGTESGFCIDSTILDCIHGHADDDEQADDGDLFDEFDGELEAGESVH